MVAVQVELRQSEYVNGSTHKGKIIVPAEWTICETDHYCA
jgi:hypothetical protein